MRADFVGYLRRSSAGANLAAGVVVAASAALAPGFRALAPAAALTIAAAALIPGGPRRLAVGAAGVAVLAGFTAGLYFLAAAAPGETGPAVWPAAFLAAKVLLLAALSAVVALASPPEEYARVLIAPFRPLTRLGVDAAPWALTAAFALRFLPASARSYRRSRDALRLRAAGKRPPPHLGIALTPLLLANAYKDVVAMAADAADALALRGCTRARDYLDVRTTARGGGWPTLGAAAATAAATAFLAYI